MTKDEYFRIKSNGKLVAIDGEWQYFHYGNAVYSLSSDGNPERACTWCRLSELRKHLRELRMCIGEDWLKRNTIYCVDHKFWSAYEP